jgi:hypothetical protein
MNKLVRSISPGVALLLALANAAQAETSAVTAGGFATEQVDRPARYAATR